MSDIFDDKRFSHVGSDPRFKNISKAERKIKIDKRFQSVFTDKKFQLKYAVDIRGRPVRETQADNYKKYYDLSSESDSEEDSTESDKNLDEHIEGGADSVPEFNGSDLKNDLNTNEESTISKKKKIKNDKILSKAIDKEHKIKINDIVHDKLQDMTTDYARGIGTIESDSSSDESSSDESDGVFVEHPWGELGKDAETTDEATKRIAICYLDWDRIYAKDLMMLLHSFLPADGFIESITVYPSEFGLERMKEEEIKGPKELVEINDDQNNEDEDVENEDAEGKAYHMEKLREYQLNRLKYYYAVVVCNSVETASKLYAECNGLEYESCAAKLDMRFVPDEMTFEQEPREVCTTLPDVTKYKPRLFENSALRQGKVTLTWDETDPHRIEFNKRVISGDSMNLDDINNYIAGSSEESEEDSEKINTSLLDDAEENSNPKDKLAKYRSIIAGIKNEEEKKKNKDVEMEISWGVGIKSDRDLSNTKSNIKEETFFQNQSNSDNNDSVSENDLSAQNSTDDDSMYISTKKKKIIKKNNNKPKKIINNSDDEIKKAELELLLTDDVLEEDSKHHFNLKAIQKQEKEGKAKKKKWRKELKKKIKSNKVEEDNFKVDVADSRFSALYTSHLYNIDPAHPQYKKTKAMEEFIAEKQKRRKLSEK